MTLPAPNPDRTCLVTGASSGIGVEIAGLLAARGLNVTLVARTQSKLEELADTLTVRHGVRAEVLAADLTDTASRSALPGRLEELGLTVNVLVNNAGFSTLGPVYRADPDREIAMVRTDVEAVVHLCTLFTPGMVERRSGCILNVASTAAFQPIPGQAGYGASKAFVLSYSHAIREELRPHGVTVTALCPGPVETGFAEAAGITPDAMAELDAQGVLGAGGRGGPGRRRRDGRQPGGGHPGPAQPGERGRSAGCRPGGSCCPSWPGSIRACTTAESAWARWRTGSGPGGGCATAGWRPCRPACWTPAWVLAFVVIGRSSHTEGLRLAGVARTAWPFLVGLAVGWAVARAWRSPAALVPTGVTVWPVCVAVGMVLRVASGQGVVPAFVGVALAFVGLGLLGWRALAQLLAARGDRGADGPPRGRT